MGIEPKVRDGSVEEYGCVILPAALVRKMHIEKGGRQAITANHAYIDFSECAADSCLALVASTRVRAFTSELNWTGILARLHIQIEWVR